MGYLIALGLLAAFSAALLHPYGRRVLGVMALVVVVILRAIWLIATWGDANYKRQQALLQQAAQAPLVANAVVPDPTPPRPTNYAAPDPWAKYARASPPANAAATSAPEEVGPDTPGPFDNEAAPSN